MANKYLQQFTNYLGGINPLANFPKGIAAGGGSKSPEKNLQNTVIPIALGRIVQTIGNWRDGVKEAEQAYYPYRVKMQQLYNDMQDEMHLAACVERRMDLTLMRDYSLVNANDKENPEWTKWLKETTWFTDYQRYGLTALYRGYALVSLGDIVDNQLPELKLIEHSVISPDRKYVGAVIYDPTGISWQDEPYNKWHIYFDTPPDIGRGACGYGIFHKCAVPAIILRNNLSDFATFNQRYGMPILRGKTDKTDDERTNFFNELKNMGAAGTVVTDTLDEIEFIDNKAGGNGFKTYTELAALCQRMISKYILGHSDAIDSIPKRSGASEGNGQTPTTPVSEALSNIRSKDGKYIEPFNNKLLDLLRYHGVSIPKDLKFKYKNDDEIEEAKSRKNQTNKTIADTAKVMKDAGLQPDAKWFEKETGIPCTPIATPPAIKPTEPLPTDIKNKLQLLYNTKHQNCSH
jgi:hypothetical protein